MTCSLQSILTFSRQFPQDGTIKVRQAWRSSPPVYRIRLLERLRWQAELICYETGSCGRCHWAPWSRGALRPCLTHYRGRNRSPCLTCRSTLWLSAQPPGQPPSAPGRTIAKLKGTVSPNLTRLPTVKAFARRSPSWPLRKRNRFATCC